MRRAALVPAGPDGAEPGDAVRVRGLGPAQEGLAFGVLVALMGEAGVVAARVAVPDVDPRLGDGIAGGVDHLDGEVDGRAGAAFGDVGAAQALVEVERPLGRLGREQADGGRDQPGPRGGGPGPGGDGEPGQGRERQKAQEAATGGGSGGVVQGGSPVGGRGVSREMGAEAPSRQRRPRGRERALGVSGATGRGRPGGAEAASDPRGPGSVEPVDLDRQPADRLRLGAAGSVGSAGGCASMLRRRWKRLSETVLMSARLRRIVGRRKTKSTRLVPFSPVELNSRPSTGMSPRPGIWLLAEVRSSVIRPPSTIVPPLSASTVVWISRRLVMMSAASGTTALLIEETSWLTSSWTTSPWLTRGVTRRVMPTSWRSMVVKGSLAVAAGGVGAGAERHVLADEDRGDLVVERGDARASRAGWPWSTGRAPGSGCRTCPPPTGRSTGPVADRRPRPARAAAAGCSSSASAAVARTRSRRSRPAARRCRSRAGRRAARRCRRRSRRSPPRSAPAAGAGRAGRPAGRGRPAPRRAPGSPRR